MNAAVLPRGPTREAIAARLSRLRPLLATPSADATEEFKQALAEVGSLTSDQASDQLVECLLAIAQYFFLANPQLML
jgi:hypothetical protein